MNRNNKYSLKAATVLALLNLLFSMFVSFNPLIHHHPNETHNISSTDISVSNQKSETSLKSDCIYCDWILSMSSAAIVDITSTEVYKTIVCNPYLCFKDDLLKQSAQTNSGRSPPLIS